MNDCNYLKYPFFMDIVHEKNNLIEKWKNMNTILLIYKAIYHRNLGDT